MPTTPPSAAAPPRATWPAWAAWLFVVFFLFNAAAPASAVDRMHEAERRGAFPRSAGDVLTAVRAYFINDADIRRAFAYANAALGRPFEPQYIRSMKGLENSGFSFDAPPEMANAPGHPLLPYRDYVVEYPPGFFLFILPVASMTGNAETFRLLFGTEMALCLTVALLLCRRIANHLPSAPPTARLVLGCAASALALGVVTTHRFDAVLSLLVCAACLATLERRPILLGLSVATAVGTKLVPILIAPLFVIHLIRQGRRRELFISMGTAVIASGVLFLPALVLSSNGFIDMLRYHRERPIQIESTPGAILGLVHSLYPGVIQVVKSFGSTNVTTNITTHIPTNITLNMIATMAHWLQALLPIFTLMGLAFVYRGAWVRFDRDADLREQGLSTVSSVAAALAVFIFFGKVFSPQYLAWFIPLGVLLSLARGGVMPIVFILILLCTQLIYPITYGSLESLHPVSCAIVLLRNGLLLYWALRIASPSRKSCETRVSNLSPSSSLSPSETA